VSRVNSKGSESHEFIQRWERAEKERHHAEQSRHCPAQH